MASIAKTINNNHSVDISINQLHEITTQQQTAINSIQGTLATQQNDIDNIKTTIADMRIFINHIIHSVSEIATKLGIQIILPPPLTLFPAPPTPLSAADENPTTQAPLSPMFRTAPPSRLAAATASFTTPFLPLDTTCSAPSVRIKPDSTSSALYLNNSSSVLKGSPKYTLQPSDQVSSKLPCLEPTFDQETSYHVPVGATNLKVMQLSISIFNKPTAALISSGKIKMCESKSLIFDPGGNGARIPFCDACEFGKKVTEGLQEKGCVDQAFDEMRHRNCNAWSKAVVVTTFQSVLNEQSDVVQGIFVATCLIFLKEANSSQEQIFILCCLCHNYASTAQMLPPLTYDLEDKVDFEGMVMIRILVHKEDTANTKDASSINNQARPRRTISKPIRFQD